MALTHDSENWRALAEECRIVAEAMHASDARQAMLNVAASYELLAQNADNRRAAERSERWHNPIW
jgi:hypothetical protein